MDQYSKYSSLVLRVGLALVLFWFGFSQIISPDKWVKFVPECIAILGLSTKTSVLLNGFFEIVSGILLCLGLFTRVVAGLVAVHMVGIVFSVGYGPTGVRDFGLAIAFVSLALSGAPHLSLDASKVFTEKR